MNIRRSSILRSNKQFISGDFTLNYRFYFFKDDYKQLQQAWMNYYLRLVVNPSELALQLPQLLVDTSQMRLINTQDDTIQSIFRALFLSIQYISIIYISRYIDDQVGVTVVYRYLGTKRSCDLEEQAKEPAAADRRPYKLCLWRDDRWLGSSLAGSGQVLTKHSPLRCKMRNSQRLLVLQRNSVK